MPSIAEWSGRPDELPAFVRWQQDGEKHDRAGDYAWMAERLPVGRVLEIGCGVGFGTRALCKRGATVLALEPETDCIAIANARCAESAGESPSGVVVRFLQAGVGEVDAAARAEIERFAPEWVVCWLMGADDSALDRQLPAAQAVQKYREAVHRQVAELAASLSSVRGVQLVDRTAFPWKIKDTARETLVSYHQATSFSGLPFASGIEDAFYRKLDQRQWLSPAGLGRHAGIVPVLGSLLARRF